LPPAVIFYISGHGFGHAIRQIALINALHELTPSLPIVIRTAAPEWLFTRTTCGASSFLPGETDTGVVQIDSLRLDVAESVRQARAFLDRFDELVEREAGIIRANHAPLVIADAPPLACAAAAAVGVPAVVCSNFTWDWIYAEYSEQPGVDSIVAETGRAYAKAHAGWRLPLSGGFETIDPIIDLPFIARHGRADIDPAGIRRAIDLPAGRPLALVSFGGYGLHQLPLDRLDCLTDWDIVVTTRGSEAVTTPPGVHVVREEQLYGRGLRYEDLVRAVDVVITKPGYGIIADCVANDADMLYTSRGRFAEYDVMVREMPHYLRCQHLALDAFEAGAWDAALSTLRHLPPPPEKIPTDGAQLAARMIAELVNAI
jgi:hypothetical protein